MERWLVNENGLKIGISNNGTLDFIVNQEEIPVTFPGILCFEGNIPNLNLGVNIGHFHLSTTQELLVRTDTILNTGDSLLHLPSPMSHEFTKDNISYKASLLPNQYERAGKLIIEFYQKDLSYNEINERLYEIANFILNNISIQYCVALNYNQFMFLHHDLRIFTIIEKCQSSQSFKGVNLVPQCNIEFWTLATGNYRKALLSKTPIERFLNLYLAIESSIACIKKDLGLNTFRDDKAQIIHSNFIEPILNVNFDINSQSKFPSIQNQPFFNILKDSHTFKGLRNKAAHAIRHSGVYSLNTSLEDYFTYYEANLYLNHMFITYMNELVKITSSNEKENMELP